MQMWHFQKFESMPGFEKNRLEQLTVWRLFVLELEQTGVVFVSDC